MKYIHVKNCMWANSEQTIINCDVNFEHLEEEFVPFSATANTKEPHVLEIFNRALSGDFGVVAPYVPPPPPTVETLALIARATRDRLLVATDWTQLPDVPQATKDIWTTYRQQLRDITEQAGFPTDIVWPIAPQ